jgi:hypothetical protein
MATAVVADPGRCLTGATANALAIAAALLRRLAGVDLRFIALQRLDRGHVAAVLADAAGQGAESASAWVAGIANSDAVLQRLAAGVDAMVAEANSSFAFRRGSVLRHMLPERLGLEPSNPRRTVAVLIGLRERYMCIEAGRNVTASVALSRWIHRARLAGRRAAAASRLADHMHNSASAAMYPSGHVASPDLVASPGAAWANAIGSTVASAARASAVACIVSKIISVALVLGLMGWFTRDLHRQVVALGAKRARYRRWLQLVSLVRGDRGTVTGADAETVRNTTECAICLGTLRNPSVPATPTAAEPEGGLFSSTVLPEPPLTTGLAVAPASGAELQVFLCGHLFHSGCARRWLTENNRCPLCRLEDPIPDAPPTGVWDDDWVGLSDDVAHHHGSLVRRGQAVLRNIVNTLAVLVILGFRRGRDVTIASFNMLRSMSARERMMLFQLASSEWPSLLSATLTIWRIAPRVFASLAGSSARATVSRPNALFPITLYETIV